MAIHVITKETKGFTISTDGVTFTYQGYPSICYENSKGVLITIDTNPITRVEINLTTDTLTIDGDLFEGTKSELRLLLNNTILFREVNGGGGSVDFDATPTNGSQNAVRSNGIYEADQAIIASVALKAPLASPTFTGVPVAPTAAADTNTTQIATTAYVVGQGYAKLASPTFTGTAVLPSTTSIGNVSSTEIGYVNGVTSSIQTQIDGKAPVDTISALTYAATTDIDLNSADTERTLSLTGNVTFTTSNRASARTRTIYITCDSTTRTLTFPAGWKWFGSAMPSSILASTQAILTIKCTDGNDSGIKASMVFEA